MRMEFAPVLPENIKTIYAYTSLYGEGSCQLSPVSMWSLSDKYGDSYAIKDGCLYVCRTKLEDEHYCVYLPPLGANVGAKEWEQLLEDAHERGKKAKFYTLTKDRVDALEAFFPGRFHAEENRDLAEYIFTRENFELFAGKRHERRRTEIRSFWRQYEDHASSALMQPEDAEDVLDFAKEWFHNNVRLETRETLFRELSCIAKQLEHGEELGLTGTVIRIDGRVRGFCYGVPLNDDFYDVLIEKGDRNVEGIYRVIRQESAKLNCQDFSYINFEEDVGEPGLRKIKESYGPEYLIEKFIVTEL